MHASSNRYAWGFYTAATVHDALRAAGGPLDGVANADLREATALIVEDGSVRLAQMSEALVECDWLRRWSRDLATSRCPC